MDKDSTLYNLISRTNRLREIKAEYEVLHNEIAELFTQMTHNENVIFNQIVRPNHVKSELRFSVKKVWDGSLLEYRPINLGVLMKWGNAAFYPSLYT